ncbi:MAG: hypothetical protein IPL59_26875 [Candidatus Competibacteraceae bacterium]|nr:hypothetical protein [Candidatus Competibacteraceae bacterium]
MPWVCQQALRLHHQGIALVSQNVQRGAGGRIFQQNQRVALYHTAVSDVDGPDDPTVEMLNGLQVSPDLTTPGATIALPSGRERPRSGSHRQQNAHQHPVAGDALKIMMSSTGYQVHH